MWFCFVEGGPGVSVVIVVDAVREAVIGSVVLQAAFLIDDGVAVPDELIVAAEALIQRRVFFFRLPVSVAGRLICGKPIIPQFLVCSILSS